MTRHLLRGAAITLTCWLTAEAGPDCGAIPVTAKITEIGAFSNLRHTEEHAYGYTVMLWRSGNCVFGLFESSAGLAGDTPIGELHQVKYDAKNGTLSFTAKLTTGVVRGAQGDEPSHDLFRFEGTLRSKRLAGMIAHAQPDRPGLEPTREKADLPASSDAAEFMHGPATYGEWREAWQPVLKFRGPKW
jgi:hypothetical protein